MARNDVVGRATVYLRANGDMLEKDVKDYGKRITKAFDNLEANIEEARERRAKNAIKDIAEYIASDDLSKLFGKISNEELKKRSKDFIKWIKHDEKYGRISVKTSAELREKIERDVNKRLAESAEADRVAQLNKINELHAKALGMNNKFDKDARKNTEREAKRAANRWLAEMTRAHSEALRINEKLDREADRKRQTDFDNSLAGRMAKLAKRQKEMDYNTFSKAALTGDWSHYIDFKRGDVDGQYRRLKKFIIDSSELTPAEKKAMFGGIADTLKRQLNLEKEARAAGKFLSDSFADSVIGANLKNSKKIKQSYVDAFALGDFSKLVDKNGDIKKQTEEVHKRFIEIFEVSPKEEEQFAERLTSWSRDARFTHAKDALRNLTEGRKKLDDVFKHDDSFSRFKDDLKAIAEDGDRASRAFHALGRASLTFEYRSRRANEVLDRTSTRFGELFGTRSRNRFVHGFGAMMQGVFNLVTLPLKMLAPVTKLFSNFYSGFTMARQSGAGMWKSLTAGAKGSMGALKGLGKSGLGAFAALLILGKGLTLVASLLSMLAANAVIAAGALGYALLGAVLPLGPALVATATGFTTMFASINQSKKASKVLKSFTDQVKKDLRDAGDALANPLDRFLKVILPETSNGIRLFGKANVKIMDSLTETFKKLAIKPPPIKIPKIELPKKVSVSKSLIDLPRIKALIDPEFKFGTKDVTQAKKHFGPDVFRVNPGLDPSYRFRLREESKKAFDKFRVNPGKIDPSWGARVRKQMEKESIFLKPGIKKGEYVNLNKDVQKHFGKGIFFKPGIESGEYVRLNSEIKKKIKKAKLEIDATPVDGWLGNFSKRLSRIWQNIGTGIGFGASGLVKFFTPILPYAEKLSKNFFNMMDRFDKWAGSKEGQNKISDFMDDAWDASVKLSNALGNVGAALGTIFSSSQENAGDDFLTWLVDSTERLEAWTKDGGKDDLKGWFEDAKVFAIDFKDALSDIKATFNDLDTAQAREDIGNLIEAFGKITRVFGWLGQLSELIFALGSPVALTKLAIENLGVSFYIFYLQVKSWLAQATVSMLDFVITTIDAMSVLPGPLGVLAKEAGGAIVGELRTARDQANLAIGGIEKQINFTTNADRVKAAIISMGITAKQYDGMQVNMFITTTHRDVYRVDRYGTPRRTPGGVLKNSASGRITQGPTLGWTGEEGPEAIVPLNRNLSQVDPSVRGISALLQGKVQPTVQAGKTVKVEAGAVVVQTAASDPSIVAAKVGGGMVSALAGAL